MVDLAASATAVGVGRWAERGVLNVAHPKNHHDRLPDLLDNVSCPRLGRGALPARYFCLELELGFLLERGPAWRADGAAIGAARGPQGLHVEKRVA